MLKLLEYMVEKGLAKNQGEASAQIGFTHTNIRKIKNGENKFTIEQIEAACRITGASADFVFGFTNEMMRKPARKPLELLKEAVRVVEMQLEK